MRAALLTPSLTVVGAALIACGASSSPSSPSAATSTLPNSIAGCEITVSSDGLPLSGDPKSPYYDNLGIATTGDGRTASGFQEVLQHASAPDATMLPDGSLGVYYNSGETGGIWLARLSGATMTKVSAITVNGVLRPRWMSDVNVELINGRVRMFYLNGEGGGRRFCVAESSDGITFTVIALAARFTGTEADPTVARLADGSWLMAFSRENHTGVGFARAPDGLTFTPFATATYGVVPELSATPDGRARLYVCRADGVESYLSGDAGATWTREGVVITRAATGRAIVCDPSFVPSVGVFILKTTDAMAP